MLALDRAFAKEVAARLARRQKRCNLPFLLSSFPHPDRTDRGSSAIAREAGRQGGVWCGFLDVTMESGGFVDFWNSASHAAEIGEDVRPSGEGRRWARSLIALPSLCSVFREPSPPHRQASATGAVTNRLNLSPGKGGLPGGPAWGTWKGGDVNGLWAGARTEPCQGRVLIFTDIPVALDRGVNPEPSCSGPGQPWRGR